MYAFATLHTLLGGGGSFSAGGPGKGMYSRIYRNVLNGNAYVESANAFTSSYKELGLFGVYATVEHAKINEVLECILQELTNVAEELEEEEFLRAKNQLKSSIFMALESRSVMADDIARQVLVYGKRHTAEFICEKIDQLTMEDIQQAMKKILLSPPSMLTYGPGYDKVANSNQFVPFFQDRFK
jgi:processing peptidase subunit alpha